MTSPDRLPPKARAVYESCVEAVEAASAADPDAYLRAVARLGSLDPEHVRLVLGAAVRALLEELYPGDLDGDDLAETLSACYASAAPWWPSTDPNALVILLSGALGSHELDEEQPAISPTDVAAGAPLLVASMLARRGQSLTAYLSVALAEIARAETVELP